MKRLWRRAVLALSLLLSPAVIAEEGAGPGLLSPVHPELAEAFIAELMQRWNGRSLGELLAPEFPQRHQLLDAFPSRVPPDARLRVLSIGGIHTLDQQRIEGAVVSVVAATVQAQVEYEDPRYGYQRHEGTAEYVFRIVRRAPR